MLNIKLQLVELVIGHPVHQFFEPVHGGDPAPGAVEIIAPVGKVGRILDMQAGQNGPVLFQDLAKRLHAVPQSRFLPRKGNAVLCNVQHITLGSCGIVLTDHDVPRLGASPGEHGGIAQNLFYLFVKQIRLAVHLPGTARIHRQISFAGQKETALSFLQLCRSRYQIHNSSSPFQMVFP